MTTKRKKPATFKARVLQDRFSEAINTVGRAVTTRTTLPITNSLLLESEHGRLKVTATDLQTRMTAWVGAQIDKDGGIVAPAKALKKLVGLMPDEALSLVGTVGKRPKGKNVSEPTSLEIKSEKRTIVLDGHDQQDFPPTPVFGDDRFTINPDALALALDRTLFATCADDQRPVLCGVHLRTMGRTLRFEACDGFRLSVVEVPIRLRPGAKLQACSLDAIVPSDTLAHLRRILPRKASETRHDVALALLVNEGATNKELRFGLPAYNVDGQLIAGVFPDTENIVPAPPDFTAFDVAALTNELAAAAEVAKSGNGRVEFHIDPTANTIRVFAKAEGMSTFESRVDATGGHEARIALNVDYALDALRAMHTERATIGIESQEKPALFRPDEGGGFYHIVMPMFVKEEGWQGQ